MWFAAGVAFAAASEPIVVMGDAFVAPRESAGFGEGAATRPSARWTAVAADCLEERARGRWSLVDRTVPGETVEGAAARVDAFLSTKPKIVVVALSGAGKPERLAELVAGIQAAGAELWLVGPVGAAVGQAVDPAFELAVTAPLGPRVHRVDVLADWPAGAVDRAALSDRVGALTDAGHARLGAAVCRALPIVE